ncbi:hypothetical protein [Thiobacillus sp.]|uniref:hypothetical protein n=1 Tax=Thiobacillus sp. TaxID=924 RepID=UPI00286E861E|nr:hypothetical protein [Thiobacillus sp.]
MNLIPYPLRFSALTMACVAVISPVLAAAAPLDTTGTLCQKEEFVYFSCDIGKKKLSVCGSPVISKANAPGGLAGYLQYRFGTKGKPLELQYPSVLEHPSRHFQYYADTSGAKASAYQLGFSVDSYHYTVFFDTGAFDGTYAGVIVDPSNDKAKTLYCRVASLEPDSFPLSELRPLGMPTAEYANDGDRNF